MFFHTEGNILSILALFGWVPISLYGARRWPPAKAMAYLFFSGTLLLPEVGFFKLPGLPEFAKREIICLWLLIGALVFHRQRFRSAPKSWPFRLCLGLLVFGSTLTILLNQDAFMAGSLRVPGQVPYDAVHAVNVLLLRAIVPFYVGAVMFRSSGDLKVLFKTIAAAACLYSPLLFIELRLSPQLHHWVYGVHQHDFLQTLRVSGYRPMAFMAHGLAVGFFVFCAVLAAAILHKINVRVFRVRAAWIASYLWIVLLLCKSLASFLYSWVSVPLVLFTSPRTQALAATALVASLFLYPVARANDVMPVDEIHAFAKEHFGGERADSLMFRFQHEQRTLERALERPWFGWGGYCRACLSDWMGDLISTRDGEWIIELGDRGIVGFIGKFGLLAFPLILLVRRMKYVPRNSDRRLLAGLGVIVGLATFDLIPNSDFTRLPFLLSGALLGCLTGILQLAAVARRKRQSGRLANQRAADPSMQRPQPERELVR